MFNEISIVIPYKETTPDRAINFEFVIDRYKTLMPDAEICIGSNDGEFNQAKSLNNAIKKSTRKYILIMDSDVLIDPESINRCIELLNQGCDGVITHDNLMRLNQQATDNIINNSIYTVNNSTIGMYGRMFNRPMNCLFIIDKDILNKCGCFDDRFTGWGYTDEAFRKALFTITNKIELLTNSTIYHLNHSYEPSFKNSALLSENKKILNQFYNIGTIYDTIKYLTEKYQNL